MKTEKLGIKVSQIGFWDTKEKKEIRTKRNSPTKLTFSPTLSLFRQVGSLFCQVGSLNRQFLRSQVSGSPLESRRSDRTASSLKVSSAKFKIAISLCAAGTQRMADTCRSEQRRYKFSHNARLKLLTGGAATARTGGRHVSHWHGIKSRPLIYSGPKPETQV